MERSERSLWGELAGSWAVAGMTALRAKTSSDIQTSPPAMPTPRSWVLELFRRSTLVTRFADPIGVGLHKAAGVPLVLPRLIRQATSWSTPCPVVDVVWYGLLIALIAYIG